MKIFNIFVLFTLFLSTNFHTTLTQPKPESIAGAPVDGENGQLPKLPRISEEELNDMIQLLDTLPPELLEAFAEEGERHIKQLEAEGRDAFEEMFGIPTPDEFKTQPEEPIAGEPTPPIETPKEIEVPKPTCAQEKQCREMLKNVAELISSIRLKAEDDRTSAEQLKPWKYHLDDITYFAHVLAEDKLLKYVTDKDFVQLYNAYSTLEHELQYLDPLFNVAETTLEKVNPYTLLGTSTDASWQDVNTAYQKLYKEKHPDNIKAELSKEGKVGPELEEELQKAQQEFDSLSDAYNAIMQKEQAQQVLNSIIDSFSRAVYINNIIPEAKKVFEKYEPEALKLKEQQEELEKKARQEQEAALRRRSPFTPQVLDPSMFGGPEIMPTDNGWGTTPSIPSFDQPTQAQEGKPGFAPGQKPSAPGQAGKPGKPGVDKKEAVDKKDKKDEIKRDRRPKEPESHRVKKKLGAIQKNFDAIITEIDDKSTLPEPEDYQAGKDLFKEFKKYLETEYTDNEKKTAKGINSRLINMSNKLRDINRLMSDEDKTLSKIEKKELQQHAKRLYDDYFDKDKGSHFKKINSLLALPGKEIEKNDKKYYETTTPMKPMKKNMHTKIDEKVFAGLAEDKKKVIGDIRGKATAEYDILNGFLDAFYKLRIKLQQ